MAGNPMACPSCAEPMHADDEYGDQACLACGLCAPCEVLAEARSPMRSRGSTREPPVPDPRHHIIRCAAALAGASYHDAPPSSELCELWREMAAKARQEADDMHAEIERLRSPAAVLGEAERLLREAEILCVGVNDDSVEITVWVVRDGEDAWEAASYPTLAEGYAAALAGVLLPQVTGGRDG